MNLVWAVFPLVLFTIIGISESFAQERLLQDSDIVIDGGTLIKIIEDPYSTSTVLQVEMDTDGYILVPKISRIFANPDCSADVDSLFVLVDGEEVAFAIDENDQEVRITLSEKDELIEFISAFVSVPHTHPPAYAIFCKTLDNGIHMSPLAQTKIGFLAKDVICKVKLELVIKSNDSSPACVKPETVAKLIERGWMKEMKYDYILESMKKTNQKRLVLQKACEEKGDAWVWVNQQNCVEKWRVVSSSCEEKGGNWVSCPICTSGAFCEPCMAYCWIGNK